MQKVKVYVSIPITGKNQLQQRAHVLRVIDQWKTGPEAEPVFINPFEIGDALEQLHKAMKFKPPTWDDYMKADISALINCDVVYMCEGWKKSKGCMVEYEKAIDNGLVLMFEGDL
jgi:hypothetical protein